MIEFISIDISSTLEGDEVRDLIAQGLPNFSWRRGDSDQQGKYISGSLAGVKIQCWADENPLAMSISFRNSSLPTDERKNLTEDVISRVIPTFGQVCKIERK